jgi:glutaredoxin
MEFPKPEKGKITVYSKSGCNYCTFVKRLLQDKNVLYSIVDCDEYILEQKDEFLLFIRELAGKECKIFPMVFDDKTFIGGFNETNNYLDKLLNVDFAF